MGLPSTYQAVEYIGSTGPQFIQVNNYNTRNITRITFRVKTYSGKAYSIVGTPSDETGYTYTSHTGLRLFSTGSNNLYAGMNTGRTQTSGFTPPSTPYNGIFDTTNLQMNNTSFTLTYANNTSSTGFAIMKDKNNTSAQIEVYYLKIYEHNILKFYFVPCYQKSDNTIGMYDLINDVFYTNKGTGTFVKGGDVNITYKSVIANTIESFNDIQESLAGIQSDIKQPGIGTEIEDIETIINYIGKCAVIKTSDGIKRFNATVYDPTSDGGTIG